METNGWRQPIRYFVVAVVFLTILWLLWVARPLISSLIIAALLAYVLHPLVNLITRNTRLSRLTAVNVTYLLFLSSLVAIPAILTPIVLRQASRIPLDLEQVIVRIRELMGQRITFGVFTLSFGDFASSLEQVLTQTATFVFNTGVTTLADISTNLLWILVILVSIYYLLKDSQLLIDWLLNAVPQEYSNHAYKLLAEIDDIWGNFLRGQLLLMLIVGVMSWLGGIAVGLPGAFTLGLIAGILDLIPSLGPTLAAILAVVIAFLEGSSYLPLSNFFFALVVLGIFIVVQQIENIWIRPALMGRRLRLHPALIFVGVFGSLALFGILAALVIIPVMSSIGVIGRYLFCRLRGIEPYPEVVIEDHAVFPELLDQPLAAEPAPLPEKLVEPDQAFSATRRQAE